MFAPPPYCRALPTGRNATLVVLFAVGQVVLAWSLAIAGTDEFDSRSVTGKWDSPGNLTILGSRESIAIRFYDVVFRLPRTHVIHKVLNSDVSGESFLLVFKLDMHGHMFYDSILRFSGTSRDTNVQKIMGSFDLLNVDGRRRTILEIGDVSRYPEIEILVSTYENPTPPTKVANRWEVWDAERIEFLCATEEKRNRREKE